MIKVGDKFEIGEFEWEIIEETERGFKLQSDDKFTGLFKETFFEIMYDITKSKLNEAEKRADAAEDKLQKLRKQLEHDSKEAFGEGYTIDWQIYNSLIEFMDDLEGSEE